MNNRLLNAFMQGMTGGSPTPTPQQGYPRHQQRPAPPPLPFNNIDPRLLGALLSRGPDRPTRAMPTSVGMNRPTFSSWLDQQRGGR